MASPETERPTLIDPELLTEVSRLLTILDMDSVLEQIVDTAVRMTDAVRGALFLFDGGDLDWNHVVHTVHPGPEQNITLVTDVLDKGLAGWVVRNKQATIAADTQTDGRWYAVDDEDHLARSALCAPFIYEDQVIAVITLVHTEPGFFTSIHLQIVNVLVDQAVVAIRQTQMFNRLHVQQSQLKTVLYTIPDAILVLDAAGRILMANKAALPLLGSYDEADVTGRLLTEMVEADPTLNPVKEIILETGDKPLRTGSQWLFETRSDALKKDLQANILVWEDRGQDISGYVVALHDVTQLRDLHRFKDEMLRVASHDLRSPLSLIIGYIDMIALDLPDSSSPIHEYLEVMRRSTERMSELLDDLLRVERIRTSPLELHERVNPDKLLKVVLVNMRPFATKKNQRFDSKINMKNVSGMMADPVLIRQAMENLISNAIKYTPEEGKITVKAYVEDGYFYFAVEDNGIGIPPDDLPYIFNSFYRVKSDKVQEALGKGLGLSLVKTVVERHHGEIWVDSVIDKGSCFTFRIPL